MFWTTLSVCLIMCLWSSWCFCRTERLLTVSAVERWAEFGPGRQSGPAPRSDLEVVVGVGAQVQGQVAVSVRGLLALRSIHPAAVQDHQLKLPERDAHTLTRSVLVWYFFIMSNMLALCVVLFVLHQLFHETSGKFPAVFVENLHKNPVVKPVVCAETNLKPVAHMGSVVLHYPNSGSASDIPPPKESSCLETFLTGGSSIFGFMLSKSTL